MAATRLTLSRLMPQSNRISRATFPRASPPLGKRPRPHSPRRQGLCAHRAAIRQNQTRNSVRDAARAFNLSRAPDAGGFPRWKMRTAPPAGRSCQPRRVPLYHRHHTQSHRKLTSTASVKRRPRGRRRRGAPACPRRVPPVASVKPAPRTKPRPVSCWRSGC